MQGSDTNLWMEYFGWWRGLGDQFWTNYVAITIKFQSHYTVIRGLSWAIQLWNLDIADVTDLSLCLLKLCRIQSGGRQVFLL